MQPRKALHRQCIGVHRLYDIRSLCGFTVISCFVLTRFAMLIFVMSECEAEMLSSII